VNSMGNVLVSKALLTVILTTVAGLFLARSGASAHVDCFESYGGERRCACIGTSDCSQMKDSDCRSDPRCDKAELGAIVCSCAAKNSRTGL
jgi:hypothetical protein